MLTDDAWSHRGTVSHPSFLSPPSGRTRPAAMATLAPADPPPLEAPPTDRRQPRQI